MNAGGRSLAGPAPATCREPAAWTPVARPSARHSSTPSTPRRPQTGAGLADPGQPGRSHGPDDTGRRAIDWPNGTGAYFLDGLPFDERPYRAIITGAMTLGDVAALDNADRRSI